MISVKDLTMFFYSHHLLAVILQDNFSVNSHVNYMLTLCSQRIFLLKKLRDQGLNYRQLY